MRIQQLQRSVKNFTTASVETILRPLLEDASRSRPQFNKFDAMSIVKTLQNRAHDTKF